MLLRNANGEPLIRTVRRDDLSKPRQILVKSICIGLSLIHI